MISSVSGYICSSSSSIRCRNSNIISNTQLHERYFVLIIIDAVIVILIIAITTTTITTIRLLLLLLTLLLLSLESDVRKQRG